MKATVKALTAQSANPHRSAYHGPDSIKPRTEAVLLQLAQEKAREIAVVPLGSVVDQLATVRGLDVLLRKVAKDAGVRQLERAPALSNDPKFAVALATIIQEHLAKQAALGLGL